MINLAEVGFEPTPPKRMQLECIALDRSAIQPSLFLIFYFTTKIIKSLRNKKKKKIKIVHSISRHQWDLNPRGKNSNGFRIHRLNHSAIVSFLYFFYFSLNKSVCVQSWPSGLRRYVQVVISSEAWVRTPQTAIF